VPLLVESFFAREQAQSLAVRAQVLVLALWGSLLSIPRARAEEAVLLLEDGALRPGLCAALRIQLTDVATVRCLPRALASPLAERLAEGARVVREQGARLGVLLERDPDPSLVRMMLVSEQEDHALLALERIEDRPAPDVDRSLALKVRDTLETMRETEASPTPLAATLRTVPRREVHTLRGLVEAGGALALHAHTRGSVLLGLGARQQRGSLYGELTLTGQLASTLRRRGRAGRVVEDEWGLSLAVRLGRQWAGAALGALLSLDALHTRADGTTNDGSRGQDEHLFARVGVGLDVRVTLHEGPLRVSLRLAPTVQLDPTAQRFQLDRQTTLELGRARLWLPLSVLLEWPGGGADV
jgi:hypothetical protein